MSFCTRRRCMVPSETGEGRVAKLATLLRRAASQLRLQRNRHLPPPPFILLRAVTLVLRHGIHPVFRIPP